MGLPLNLIFIDFVMQTSYRMVPAPWHAKRHPQPPPSKPATAAEGSEAPSAPPVIFLLMLCSFSQTIYGVVFLTSWKSHAREGSWAKKNTKGHFIVPILKGHDGPQCGVRGLTFSYTFQLYQHWWWIHGCWLFGGCLPVHSTLCSLMKWWNL